MARPRKQPTEKVVMPIAPMIDAVFLMLIYFMVTSTLEKQEADLSFQLPGTVEQTDPLEMPDEQIVEIRPDGQVIVNEYPYDSPGSQRFAELAAMLNRYREAAQANRVDAIVTIAPDEATEHQYIVRVMDACSFAQITNVNFSMGEEAF